MISNPDKKNNLFWIILILVYFILLFLIVVLKFRGSFDSILYSIDYYQAQRAMGELNLNLVPLKQITNFIASPQLGAAGYNLLGNIVPFMPMGFLIPMVFKKIKKFWQTILICLAVILFIETFQFFSLTGVFDVDDIILNLVGCVFGYGIYYCTKRLSWQ